jgi:hypothetical protein
VLILLFIWGLTKDISSKYINFGKKYTFVMKRVLLLFASIVLLSFLNSCGLSVRAVADVKLPPTASVKIYNVNQALPENIERIGSVTIDDTGFTSDRKGTYDACMSRLRSEAMKMGGDVVGIVVLNTPDRHSTIYRMVADVYRYK